jgi:uncharacterized RDD family membrane protein YckC
MEIITVHTTQNIDIDYELGGLGERILACLIDLSIFLALTIIGGILNNVLRLTGVEIYFIAVGAMMLFYHLVCETFFEGQSAGKRVMKIRVISLNGARPKLSQYLLRWLFRLVDLPLTSWIGGMIFIILTEKGQRIGDIVAGTAMVRTTPRTTINKIIYTSIDDSYQPVFAEASQLKDADINLINEVISYYQKTGNTTIVYNTADKIRQYLSINLPPDMNSLKFLQTIIKDYSHITARADAF